MSVYFWLGTTTPPYTYGGVPWGRGSQLRQQWGFPKAAPCLVDKLGTQHLEILSKAPASKRKLVRRSILFLKRHWIKTKQSKAPNQPYSKIRTKGKIQTHKLLCFYLLTSPPANPPHGPSVPVPPKDVPVVLSSKAFWAFLYQLTCRGEQRRHLLQEAFPVFPHSVCNSTPGGAGSPSSRHWARVDALAA